MKRHATERLDIDIDTDIDTDTDIDIDIDTVFDRSRSSASNAASRVLAAAPGVARRRFAMAHREGHKTTTIGWLRAAVLGANDGIVSTSSLLIGVAAAHADRPELLTAGIAGVVAGAMSMAAGEYVSVSSQTDTEHADLARERRELTTEPERELEELIGIYVSRGIERALAEKVAAQLTAHDALSAHARDELGISPTTTARPVQAALASAASFAAGALLPLLVAFVSPLSWLLATLSITSLVFLGALGAVAAKTGGAPVWKATARVALWGALAMALTAGVGAVFGTVA